MTKQPEIVETKESAPVSRFTKEQILDSKRYQHRRDVLESLLSGEKTYSHADVEGTLEKFMKGKVK